MITRIVVIALAVFVFVERSPAPIVEEEKSTPAPQQSEAPRRKHSPRSTSAEQSPSAQTETKSKPAPASVAQGPARFAGTWTGKVNQGLLGHVTSSVTVNGSASSVELSHNLGGNTRPATISGNSLTWKSGLAGEITWTLTPNNDSQTAQVTMKGLMLNDTATFRRGQAVPSTSRR
jgi:cytoskeletal protein RodZ